MRKRVTLSIQGDTYSIVVRDIDEFDRMNSKHAYILRGVEPEHYPEPIRDEVRFFSGMLGAGTDLEPERWPVAHISPQCDVTVEGWEETDEPLPGADESTTEANVTESASEAEVNE